jgi:hypothetical protein
MKHEKRMKLIPIEINYTFKWFDRAHYVYINFNNNCFIILQLPFAKKMKNKFFYVELEKKKKL